MDLAALTVFRAVVRENGVTRAAAKLNRVQSNVTTRIKQLEAQLGTPLFVRDGRRLVLTPAGETLLPYAERLLALADEAKQALCDDRPHGRLALGTMESTAASRLPARLARYHRRWPEVALELTTGTTGCLIERLRKFEIDAALVARPPEADSLEEAFETMTVFREELIMLTPRDHRPIRVASDIALDTLVAFERGCMYRAHIERWYTAHGIRPARVLELGSYHAMVACVAAGAGVAVAPRSVFEVLPRGATDVALHPLKELGLIDTLLVWRRGQCAAALRALGGMLVEATDAPDASGSLIADKSDAGGPSRRQAPAPTPN